MSRPTLAISALAALAVALPHVAVTAPSVASQHSERGRTAPFSAVIVDAQGEPAGNVFVKVGALPTGNTGRDLAFETIGQGTTDTQGRVAFRLAMKDKARYVDASGLADLRVWAQSPDGRQSSAYSLVVTAADTWTVSAQSAPKASDTAMSSSALTTAEAPERTTLSDFEFELVEGVARVPVVEKLEDARGNGVLAPQAAATAGLPFRPCRVMENEALVGTSYYARRFLPVKVGITKKRSKMTYSYSSSSNTKWTVATNGANGGFARSANQSSSMGKTWTVNALPPSSTATFNRKSLEVEWQYRQYDVRCYDPMIGMYTADTGKDEWRPWKWTAGDRVVDSKEEAFTCYGQNLVEISTTTWMAKATTAQHTNQASLYGVTLKQEQTSSSGHKITVTPVSGTARICGDNNLPPYAKKIREY